MPRHGGKKRQRQTASSAPGPTSRPAPIRPNFDPNDLRAEFANFYRKYAAKKNTGHRRDVLREMGVDEFYSQITEQIRRVVQLTPDGLPFEIYMVAELTTFFAEWITPDDLDTDTEMIVEFLEKICAAFERYAPRYEDENGTLHVNANLGELSKMLKTLRSLIDSGRLDDAKEMIPSIISFTAFATKKCLTRVRGPTDNCPVCQIDSASCTTMIEQSELLLEALSQAVGAQVTYESLQCVEEDCFLRMDAHTKSGTWDNGTVWETFSEELDADKEIKAFLSGNNIVGRHRRETKNAKPLHVDQVLGFLVTAGAAYLMRSVHGPDVNVVLLIYSRRTSELLGFDTGSLDPREGTLVTSGPLPHPSANYTLPGQRFAKFLGKYDQVLSLAMAEFKRRRVEVDVYADDGLTETRVIEVDSTRAYSELVASYKRGLSDATLERRAEAEGLATALARLRQVEKALGKRAIYSAKSAENDEKRANRERKRTNMAESQPELDESMLELLS